MAIVTFVGIGRWLSRDVYKATVQSSEGHLRGEGHAFQPAPQVRLQGSRLRFLGCLDSAAFTIRKLPQRSCLPRHRGKRRGFGGAKPGIAYADGCNRYGWIG